MRWGHVVVSIAIACGSPPPPAPSAVIVMSPSSVCAGDAFGTPIHLDATSSAQALTLVYVRTDPNAPPLSYTWSFEGAAMMFDEGDAHGDTLTVRSAGDRPLHVTLEVRNSLGGVTNAKASLSITPVDAAGRCPLPPP